MLQLILAGLHKGSITSQHKLERHVMPMHIVNMGQNVHLVWHVANELECSAKLTQAARHGEKCRRKLQPNM